MQTTSRPATAAGQARDCAGVGAVYDAASAAWIEAQKGASAKDAYAVYAAEMSSLLPEVASLRGRFLPPTGRPAAGKRDEFEDGAVTALSLRLPPPGGPPGAPGAPEVAAEVDPEVAPEVAPEALFFDLFK